MDDCLLLPVFPWTPIVQTSAANWLTRFKWKEKLSTLGRECIVKTFRAVFWEIRHLIECHISLWPDFALSIVFFYFSFYERQTNKPARPIGWLGLCERKYCVLCREKVSCKNFEPFWRNITSKTVMSYMLLPRFRHITWFFLSVFLWTPGFQISAANWLTSFMWKEILSTWRRESIMKKLRAVLEKYSSKIVF